MSCRYGTPGFGSSEFAAALSNGTIRPDRLDDMAIRVLIPMYALGLVDDPPSEQQNTTANTRSSARDSLALKLNDRSICLLKNDRGLLPFLPAAVLSAAATATAAADTAVDPSGRRLDPAESSRRHRTRGPLGAKKQVLVFGDEATVAGHGSGGVAMPFISLVTDELAKLYDSDQVEVRHPQKGGVPVSDPATAAAMAASADLVVVVVRVQTGEGT
jgi:beta-glucosidase-like glycosyl hydrolase